MKYIPAIAILLVFASCSTTRVLGEGEYRLRENKVTITNDREFPKSELTPYVKQRANTYFLLGWNPFLNIYNWSTPGSDDLWSRICRKIGQKPVVLDESLIPASRENLTEHLRYLGFYDSGVESTIKYRRRLATVNYDVTLGQRYKIDEIRFHLPQDETFAAEFCADTLNLLVKRGDWLSEQMLEEESARSASYMRNLGYYSFSKNNYFFIADTLESPGKLILNYDIRNYTRSESPKSAAPIRKYKIGNVTIEHSPDLPFREKVLLGLNTIHPGDTYNERSVNTVYERMSSLKLFNSVSVEMNPVDSTTVDCRIRMSESTIQGFKLNLEASTNSSGLVGISPKLSYFHKNIFHGGEWLNLNVHGNFQFKFKDPTRSTEAGFSASLSFPKIVGVPYSAFRGSDIPRTETGFSFAYQDRSEYKRNVASLTFGITGTMRKRFQYQIYLPRINFVHLYNLDPEFEKSLERNPFMRYAYQDHFDAGLSANAYYTTNSDIVPKTDYHYYRFGIDLSGNLVSALYPVLPTNDSRQGLVFGSPYSQYVRGEFSVGKTFSFGRGEGYNFAFRFFAGAGYAYGNSTAMPFEKQFYCGGAGSMRGWQARALGPGASPLDKSFSIPSQTGEAKLELDLEYRMPIFWKFEWAVFAECGNVWNIKDSGGDGKDSIKTFYKTLAGDWGLGLRLNLDFILIRVDWGFQIYDPAASSWYGIPDWFGGGKSCIHFGVGYPF